MNTLSCTPVRGHRSTPRNPASVAIAILAALLVITLSPVAGGAALTLAEAQRRAIERSRELPAQDQAAYAAGEMAVAAAQLPDPVVQFGLDSWPVTGRDRFSFDDDDFTMGRLAVSQEWTRSGKRKLRGQRYDRTQDITRAEQAALAADIQRETALAWFERYYAEAIAALVAAQHAVATHDLIAGEAAYRGGRGTQAEVLALRGALVELEDAMSATTLRTRTAATMLERWIGGGAAEPLAAPPATDAVPIAPVGLEEQLTHHPQVRVLARKEDLAWTEAALAEADKRADWNVELAYGARSAFSDLVSITLSIPFQIDQDRRQDRALAAQRALAAKASAEKEEAVREHAAEIATAIEAWRSGRARTARWRRERLPLATQQVEAALAAHAAGTAALAEVLAARRAELAAHVQLLELELGTALAWAELEFQFPHDGAAPDAPLIHSLQSSRKSRP